MSRIERVLRRIKSDEGGFSLIELLVAATFVAGGLAAVLTTFDGSRELVTHAERNETASHQAQQQLERVYAMDYADVGHAAGQTPAPSGTATHPDFYVRSGGRYQWDHRNTSRLETLVTGTGTLTRFRSWVDGRLRGRVYTYVTWYFDSQIVQTPTDQPDAKRVTVAVTVDGGDQRLKPVVASSIVFDKEGLQP